MKQSAKASLGLVAVIMLATTAALATAQEEFQFPELYRGSVQIIGPERTIGAPPGAVVAAFFGEDEMGSFTVTQENMYGWLLVPTDPEDYIPPERPIEFRVNGVRANETSTFHSTYVTEFNLTVNDDVAPIVNNLQPSPGETVGTRTPMIAADYSDVLSGIDIASVMIKIDGSDVTAAATVTASSVSYIPTVALANDNYTAEVSVRDRVGNPTTESWSFAVYVPPAPPVPPTPPAPATLTVDTTPIKASVYVNDVLWGIAPQTRSVEAGSYTVSFGDFLGYLTPSSQTVTLAAGENRIVTSTYTEIPPELIENESPPIDIPSITTDENATIEVENTAITGMTIDVGEDVEDVRVTVQQLTDTPAEIAIGAPGATYCYLNIVAENITDADIDVVLINFRVEKAWITAENIDPDTIALLRWDPVDEEWDSLPTTRIGEDDTYYYYSAESPGLSIFAVTGSVTEVTPSPPPPSPPGPPWATVIVLLLAAMVIAIAVFYVRRKSTSMVRSRPRRRQA